ncbi:MAG: hypothetical protein N2513_09620 [Deltaproteobacteria bacterium]|nr:hypothetical protein [Deltaproteobacteria bacterium]
MIGPKKLNQALTLKEVDLHRNLECPSYDNCLEKAVLKNWASFSCEDCEHFVKIRLHEEPYEESILDVQSIAVKLAVFGFLYMASVCGVKL